MKCKEQKLISEAISNIARAWAHHFIAQMQKCFKFTRAVARDHRETVAHKRLRHER